MSTGPGTGSVNSAQSGASPSGTSTADGRTSQGSTTSTGGSASDAATSAAGNGSGSSASAHTANGVSACTGTQLKVTLGRAGAAGGHAGQPLVFTNTSSQTCTMQGYLGAAIMNGSTIVLNAAFVADVAVPGTLS